MPTTPLQKAVKHITHARGCLTEEISERGSTQNLLDLSHTLLCVQRVLESHTLGLNIGVAVWNRALGDDAKPGQSKLRVR
jgi:hypothetical protein